MSRFLSLKVSEHFNFIAFGLVIATGLYNFFISSKHPTIVDYRLIPFDVFWRVSNRNTFVFDVKGFTPELDVVVKTKFDLKKKYDFKENFLMLTDLNRVEVVEKKNLHYIENGLFEQNVTYDLTMIHSQFLVMLVLASVLYFLSKIFSKKIFNLEKKSAYECGFEPFLILTTFIEVGFILVAFIFLIFDLELIFLSAFLIASGSIGSGGILLVVVYLSSVWVMVFFEVFSGVLSWPVWNIFKSGFQFSFYSIFNSLPTWRDLFFFLSEVSYLKKLKSDGLRASSLKLSGTTTKKWDLSYAYFSKINDKAPDFFLEGQPSNKVKKQRLLSDVSSFLNGAEVSITPFEGGVPFYITSVSSEVDRRFFNKKLPVFSNEIVNAAWVASENSRVTSGSNHKKTMCLRSDGLDVPSFESMLIEDKNASRLGGVERCSEADDHDECDEYCGSEYSTDYDEDCDSEYSTDYDDDNYDDSYSEKYDNAYSSGEPVSKSEGFSLIEWGVWSQVYALNTLFPRYLTYHLSYYSSGTFKKKTHNFFKFTSKPKTYQGQVEFMFLQLTFGNTNDLYNFWPFNCFVTNLENIFTDYDVWPNQHIYKEDENFIISDKSITALASEFPTKLQFTGNWHSYFDEPEVVRTFYPENANGSAKNSFLFFSPSYNIDLLSHSLELRSYVNSNPKAPTDEEVLAYVLHNRRAFTNVHQTKYKNLDLSVKNIALSRLSFHYFF